MEIKLTLDECCFLNHWESILRQEDSFKESYEFGFYDNSYMQLKKKYWNVYSWQLQSISKPLDVI